MSDLDTIFSDVLPEGHRSGVIAVVGRPNVGKSTLINAILGQKIAIVSPRPQTTRRQQLGIFTTANAQVLFVDTPGLHKPQHKLGEYMVGVAETALRDADIILWVLDVSEAPQISDKYISQTMERLRKTALLVLAFNKIDATPADQKSAILQEHGALIEHQRAFPISALNDDGVGDLVAYLVEQLPQGPRYYPVDQVSEVNMRFIAAETIREKVMVNTDEEVPHSVAVEIDQYKERSDSMTYISATVYVERDSQKGILIGKSGAKIKQIGTEAREELKAQLGTDVYLELNVKVLKNWRSDEDFMKRLGYRLFTDDKE
jgi:GTPase